MASPEKIKRLQKWIWVFIYGGLLTFVFGLAVQRVDDDLGPWFIAPGAVFAALGFFLIYVRSRLTVDGAPPAK